MNCPECGRFMKLFIAFEATHIEATRRFGRSLNVWECAYYWWCDNEWGHTYIVDPIPAPEYQWLWNCEGIPEEALTDWPELKAECDAMWAQLPESKKKLYR